MTGESVAALLRHCGVREAILVGHSLGGMVAMDVAARSHWVKGLLLLEGWTSLAAAGAFAGERFYGQLDAAAIIQIKANAKSTRERFAPAIWEAFWDSVKAFDAASYLRAASIPIMEVYGALGCYEATKSQLLVPPNPCISWHWVEGAGHYLPHERPGEVAKLCHTALAMRC